ncbi:hypothetical protein [Metapseudomonas otitidis]|uniref:hypothetical protein n=1 Tax=Metapseudomonas otitidis TaxID=319939 RepID=UPI0013F5F266|nr:hypothetical protein [Pseudomonas otitidis]
MITRIPALEFMQRLVGAYQSQDGKASLRVKRLGYGQVIELYIGDKLQLSGVVGASGESVELYALLGLPNVIRLGGSFQTPTDISFEDPELQLGLKLSLSGDTLTLTTTNGGSKSSKHVLQRI